MKINVYAKGSFLFLGVLFGLLDPFVVHADEEVVERVLSRWFASMDVSDDNSIVVEMIKWQSRFRVCRENVPEHQEVLDDNAMLRLVQGSKSLFLFDRGISLAVCVTNDNAEVKSWRGDLILVIKSLSIPDVSWAPEIRSSYLINVTRGKAVNEQTKVEADFAMPFKSLWKNFDDYLEKSQYEEANCRKPYELGEEEMKLFLRRGRRMLSQGDEDKRSWWTVAYAWDEKDALKEGSNRYSHVRIARLKKIADGYSVFALANVHTNGFYTICIYDDKQRMKCRLDRQLWEDEPLWYYNEYDEGGAFVRSKKITKSHPLWKSGINDLNSMRFASEALSAGEDMFNRFMVGDIEIPTTNVCQRPRILTADEVEQFRKLFRERDSGLTNQMEGASLSR